MRRGLLYEEDFKPQFSGHETFPLKYGWLKKVYDEVHALQKQGKKSETKKLFSEEEAIACFGVGKNMVASMRHWATVAGVIKDDKDKALVTTPLAKLLLSDDGLDPWLESTSSLWTFHWNIAANSQKATYIWLFSYFNNTLFERSTLVNLLLEVCAERWKGMAERTIKSDVECLVRTYVNKPSKDETQAEDQIECPLAELGLIQPVSNNNSTFQIRRGHHPTLGEGAFLYALVDFWQRHFKQTRVLSLEAITYEPCSPGRVLCLDEDAVAERLYSIEQSSKGQIDWSETSGMRQIRAKRPLDELEPLEFLKQDYRSSRKKVA